MAQRAKKITVGIGEVNAEASAFVDVAGLMGEFPFPEISAEIAKFQPNDADHPELVEDDLQVGGIELTLEFKTHASFATIYSHLLKLRWFKFTMPSGEAHIFEGKINKINRVSGAENKAAVGKIGIEFSHCVSDTAEPTQGE